MFAQKLSVCFKENCSVIEIKDVTGLYSNPDNVQGWGSPNVELSEVTLATLTIILPNGDDTVIDVTSVVNSATIVDGEFLFNEITPTDVGLTTATFGDGIYEIVYTIEWGEDQSSVLVVKNLVYCATKCCVDKMLEKAIDAYLCGKNCKTSNEIYEALKARALLLQAMKWAQSCFDIETAQKLLNQANKLCGSYAGNCGCGCS